MAVKMLTTKKHSKTAKLIQKSKETIEVAKPTKKVAKKPIAKKVILIGKREYNRALKIVNQYLKQNEIEKS
jgi:hypothetical protein